MVHIPSEVEIWEEKTVIPTYEVGKADKNPMFIEKRVYQGSTGKVYPCPVIDKIFDEKHDKAYNAVFLENDFLRIMILPELGGRIQRAYDKTNGYDFVYYNEVIKPALVGLAGPWISGGIEFNWPQHHRPSTFSPVDYKLQANAAGSKTVLINETDQMYGTKALAGYTLYPDKAYLEIKGQLYNPTPLPQTFLWWANPAVSVNEYTQSVFPPDVNAVMDHGKRDVSRFPIATGTYYKHDYSAGVDISRYKNIPVPTSYMAYHSDYDFVGQYDFQKEAGILHIADHHISPGKKQWTWGSGDFGKAWDRNLTDENGPYIELMTGVFTDNQPDFSWLKPFEEKSFVQYFMPYKKAEYIKNASIEALLNLEVSEGKAKFCVYATAVYPKMRVVLSSPEKVFFNRTTLISPNDILKAEVLIGDTPQSLLTLSIYDAEKNRFVLSYTPQKQYSDKIPEPAQPAKEPEEIRTNEELYLTGLHIEQYRHATYEPDGYYLEGLRRDPGDIRINNAYGLLLFRRGLFSESESFFRKAVLRSTWKNPNPYDSEAYYNLGLSLFYQNRFDEAFDAFYKATWTNEQQEMAFYYLAAIAARRMDFSEAFAFTEKSLIKNSHNLKARGLKAILLRKMDRLAEAENWIEKNLEIDDFDFLSQIERSELSGTGREAVRILMRNSPGNFIAVAADYAESGFYTEAIRVLQYCTDSSPMLKYYEAFYAQKIGDDRSAAGCLAEASIRPSLYCFPNKLTDIPVLEYAITANPTDSKTPYYLGCLFYDRKQYIKARQLWETSAAIDPAFPTVWRNLSLVYYNKTKEPGKAKDVLEKAYALDPTDARVFLELDQLNKKMGVHPKDRLAFYENHREVFIQRDDLYAEYATLLNTLGRHQEAYTLIMNRKFHPWEGGEGKVSSQYALALTELAKIALRHQDYKKAISLLNEALVFPENLGEGKLESAKDNDIYYYLGCAYDKLNQKEKAAACWERAAAGNEEPAGMMYYNDQPANLILYQGLANRNLGREAKALSLFQKLIRYGENHMNDTVRLDYFAVSLPDLQLFNDDLTLRNKAHCHFLIALGSFGMGDFKRAKKEYGKTLEIDCAHLGAIIHNRLLENEMNDSR